MPFTTEISPVDTELSTSAADLLVIPVRASTDGATAVVTGRGEIPAQYLPAPVQQLVDHYDLTGTAGDYADLVGNLGSGLVRIALLGVGAGTGEDARTAAATLARRSRGRSRVAMATPQALDTPEAITAFCEGFLLAGYTYTLREKPSGKPVAAQVDLLTPTPAELEPAVHRGAAYARATALARDLTNTPSSIKGPGWLAEQAVSVAEDSGLQARVWDAEQLRQEGFGAILAVGAGSAQPPRLVQLSYTPDQPDRHVVLAGKGITFDTGGLSLKPQDNMQQMKTDMAGAGVVLGVMSELARLRVPVQVTALLAIAENSVSGSAMRPGDVITTYAGTTVEVLNTDAEGRLVLADALAYAAANLAPDTVVDVATLTGAAKRALGLRTGALYATDDPLASAIEQAGTRSGERFWRMPLEETYRDSLDSTVADLANIGTKPHYGSPGATEAALFLREFTAGVPWAHLDVAGPGRSTANRAEITKGATGFATRTLLRWLRE
ncbi:leucyl aminopeptidase [Lipingzhangella sp. LS1_29]|uniref:Probable cytosol aminopeptidase n=1 Tax=Lipingzhangella rawalii TaxID=2055835 RepID=A0ABU2H566_9ACTN|nr:leucyl aminopeptidase [Lipingzhangella rawalii]MDS1269764.1 leucyl aminopeptidase [Lipingzhangella rawalii]